MQGGEGQAKDSGEGRAGEVPQNKGQSKRRCRWKGRRIYNEAEVQSMKGKKERKKKNPKIDQDRTELEVDGEVLHRN